MLEGKEIEGKLGSVGVYSVDVSDKLMLEASVGIKIDLLEEAKKLAAGKPLLEKLVGMISAAVGRG